MPELNLKPTHKTVQDYYRALGQFEHQNASNEMTVRSAFQTLLAKCGQQFDWMLVPEYPVRRPKQMPLKVDGALLDTFRLAHGFWEAKDEKDELEREVEHKLTLGYPDKNIIFQSPKQAILIQRGRLAWKNSIVEPDALVEVLQHFFAYSDPKIMGWQEAADRFKSEVPEQSRALKEIIDEQHKKNRAFVEAFTAFVETCRQALNPNLSEDAVERMLIQHILTERIFSKVFDNEDFRTRNVVAVEIEKVIATLIKGSFNRGDFLRRLDPFYKAIEQSAANTTGYTEKQEFLNTVYERFFQGFSPKEADTHGIVYTPQPIVDFMVRSVEDILEKEFGKSLADKGVHILDPFVGTGNFITRVMKEIAAKKKSALPYKYANELHCNEIMLLPYYIASMNIEHEYLDATGEYEPFPGICLVDTFELAEAKQHTLGFMNEENTARVQRQKKAPIFVVMGNPPYNVGQANENDNNKNRKYPEIDRWVYDQYAKTSNATNRNALSDPYVKAICWAAARVGEEGIVAYVSNSSFVHGVAFDGMRSMLSKQFSHIIHINLKGDARTSADRRKQEGGNIFDDAIRVGVGITFFVKKVDIAQNASIQIFEVDHYLSAEQKRNLLDSWPTCSALPLQQAVLNSKGAWVAEADKTDFDAFIPIGGKRATPDSAIFATSSNGVKTNRDLWVYDANREHLAAKIQRTIEFYNTELARWQGHDRDRNVSADAFVRYDDSAISWSRDLKLDLERGKHLRFSPTNLRKAIYRPFYSAFLYFDRVLNEEVYLWPHILPTPSQEQENRNIVITDIGHRSPHSALMTSSLSDVHLCASDAFQCFPFYTYDGDGTNRRENITDWALEQFRTHYADRSITKWDIFHYVYAVLHHPEYRERYAPNLKRELPRVPFVGEKQVPRCARNDNRVFREFVKAGERLAELHVRYEEQPDVTEKPHVSSANVGHPTGPHLPKPGRYGAPQTGPAGEGASATKPVTTTWVENPSAKLDYHVEKMKLSKDKSTLFYNDYWTLTGIPAEVYEYRLGNRSALEWIVDQYQVSTDKRSGITNDPNREDDPEYIKRLIGQVIYVSLETVKAVKSLPELVLAAPEKVEAATK
jgi:predicted helicase